MIVGGGWGGDLRIWRLETRELIGKIENAHLGIPVGLAIGPDGHTLATGGNDQVIRLWDLNAFEETSALGGDLESFEAVRVLSGHHSEVWSLKFRGDGRRLASASKDGTVKIWDPGARHRATHSTVWEIPENLWAHGYTATGDALRYYDRNAWFPKDGQTADRTLHILNVDNGSWEKKEWGLEARGDFDFLIWKPGQKLGLFGRGGGGEIMISDGRVPAISPHPVEPEVLSSKGNYLVARVYPPGESSYAVLWDVAGERVLKRFDNLYGVTFPEWTFSSSERYLAYAKSDFSIHIWSIEQGQTWVEFPGHPWRIYDLEFSDVERLLASGSWDGDCRVWDVEKKQAADPHVFRGHISGVHSVQISPDGRTLASLSDDEALRIWNIATGQEMLAFPVHRDPRIDNASHQEFRMDHDRILPMTPDGNHLMWTVLHEGKTALRVTRLRTLEEIDAEIRSLLGGRP